MGIIALTRAVSRTLEACELTCLPRQKIDIGLAIAQHRHYERCLRESGARVISLPEQPDLPDAVFVEDPLIVLDELAIVAPMGCASRRKESESLAEAILPFRPVRRLRAPATLEGGDVMRIGRDIFVGLSSRTNDAGISQLAAELEPFGYRVRAVEVRGCLHLKSACCPIGHGAIDAAILANRMWLDERALAGYPIVDVADEEPGAANILNIAGTILMPAAFPRTERILRRRNADVRTLDISELMKAEAAMTCSSVLFNDTLTEPRA